MIDMDSYLLRELWQEAEAEVRALTSRAERADARIARALRLCANRDMHVGFTLFTEDLRRVLAES